VPESIVDRDRDLPVSEDRAISGKPTQEIDTMKKILAAMTVVLALPMLAACNTIEGIGKDVKAGGQAVEEVARDTREEITN